MNQDNIEQVAEHVLDMADKYGFKPDNNTIDDAISDSASILELKLSRKEINSTRFQIFESLEENEGD